MPSAAERRAIGGLGSDRAPPRAAVLQRRTRNIASASLVPAAHLGFSLRQEELSPPLVNLARYPTAGLLRSVPTHPASPPAESLLFPVEAVPLPTFWCCSGTAAEILVALALAASIHKVRECRAIAYLSPVLIVTNKIAILLGGAAD